MSAAPQTPVGRITILCAAFVVFAGNASGLLEFSLHSGIDLRSAMLISPLDGTVMLPPAMRSAEFLVLLACGALLSALLPMLSPVRGAMLAATTVIAPFATYLAAPAGRAYLLEYTLLMIAVLYFLHVLCSYFVETQSKQKIVRIFGQYVPPSLVSEISRQPDALDLEGEARRLTVFFCDIQDFSAIAEQLNPRQLARLLNEYFTQMTEILFRHGATIDKYIGDSIMAFWGAPLAQPDHARRAVLASFEMHREIERLGAEFAKRGWPGPAMGIGANTGIMNVGNMGSKYRLAYTVVGDAVNLASRLESLTRTYRVPTIVSEATRQECPGIVFRTLDIVQVRGKVNKTVICQPIGIESEVDALVRARLEQHEAGIDCYMKGDLKGASEILGRLQREMPQDPYYRVMNRKLQHEARN